MLNVIFMGAPDFAVPSLEKIAKSRHHVQCVLTHPDKKRGRGGKTVPTAVKRKAEELKLPVIENSDMKDPELHRHLAAYQPDLFVVVAFRILPQKMLEIPKIGAINLHASLLPKYRGAAPIHWAVLNGERETGATVFMLDRSVDTGAIISQRSIAIGPDETTGSVYERLMKMGSDLLLQTVNDIDSGDYHKIPQNDAEATPAPKIFKEDAQLDPQKTAREVHNCIRGYSPFPGAWSTWEGKTVKFYASTLGPEKEDSTPGRIYASEEGRLLLECGRDTVEILEIQVQGKKRISGQEFINGYQFEEAFLGD